MARVSYNLVGLLNLVTFLLSIPILGGGIWLANRASTDCERYLEKPVIAIGVLLMLVSLAGIIGACCRVSWLLWVYLLVMLLLIVILFCLTIFAFVITDEGAGEVVSGEDYKEYRLWDNYPSPWLRKRLENTQSWNKIKLCISDSKMCSKFNQIYLDDTAEKVHCENIMSSSLKLANLTMKFATDAVHLNNKLVIARQTIDRLKEEAAQGEECHHQLKETVKLKEEVAKLKAALKEAKEKLASPEHFLLMTETSVESQKADVKDL